MEIQFNEDKSITIREAEIKTVSKVTIDRLVDNPIEKKVIAFISEIPSPITLWSGDEYDNIGQWTDENVKERLIEIFA